MKNGRENRTNGNQKEGKKEKEALRKLSTKSDRGRKMRPLSFLWLVFILRLLPQFDCDAALTGRFGMRFSFAGHRLRYEQNVQ